MIEVKRRAFLENILAGAASAALSGCSSAFLLNRKVYYPYSSGNKQKVLLIGLDGIRPDALYAARTPHLDELIAQGGYSDAALTGTYTLSAPGWSNLLCGVWENKHGVTNNSFLGSNYENYPSLFSRLENLRPDLYTVSLVSWKPINKCIVTAADKRESYNSMTGDSDATKNAVRVLSREDPDVMFLYFGDVDLVGHNYGFHPSVSRYVDEIEEVDGQIGHVLKALYSRPTYSSENWLIICTTDHGGTMSGHGENTPECRTIFYIAAGSSAYRGRIPETPEIVDAVPTIFQHLNIPVDPAWGLDGKVCGLKK